MFISAVIWSLLISSSSLVLSAEIDLTVEIAPGRDDCFYQNIGATSSEVELDYQVIDGGDLDIDVFVYSPENAYLHIDSRKTENVIKFNPKGAGDYKFCFSNSFSTMSKKVVYFELFTGEEEDEAEKNKGLENLTFESEHLQDQLDMTVKDFVGILDRAKNHLDRSEQVQTLLRIHESKDRSTQENNFIRVNLFSAIQMAVMVVVAIVQVVMIRSLFKDKASTKGSALRMKT